MLDDLVYITRKFPPATGGMENLAAEIWKGLEGRGDPRLIALGRSQRHLLWFLPWAALRVATLVASRRARRVLCGDPLVAVALLPVLAVTRVPFVVVVHGLDLTFSNRLYQALMHRALTRASRLVAISRATLRAAEEAGVTDEKTVVIHPGLTIERPSANERESARARVRRRLGVPSDSVVVVTVGRLVARKGVAWFVEAVLPKLSAQVVYVVVGEGPDAARIHGHATAAGVEGRVHLLGFVDDATRRELILAADVFVMPNVPVAKDMEGFGLVAVEAVMLGTLVIAARLEGIEDATASGETAILCPSRDADAFVDALSNVARDPDAAHQQAARFQDRAYEVFSNRRMTDDFVAVLKETTT